MSVSEFENVMAGEDNNAVTSRRKKSKSKRLKRSKRSKRPKPPSAVAMRQCALPDCGVTFYPQREWQKFHDPSCAVKDRQRRLRERYRKLLSLNHGDITEGIGGRKIISRRGSRDLTRAEANIIAEIRRIGQPAINMVTAMLADPPRNRSPEMVGDWKGDEQKSPASPAAPKLSHRLRNIRRVHPRSLENT